VLIFNPENAPAIHLRAPFIATTFRHTNIAAQTAFGRTAWKRQYRGFVEAESPSGKRANDGALARLNLNAPVMPIAPQLLEFSVLVAVSLSPAGSSECEYSRNHNRDDGTDQEAVDDHANRFRVRCAVPTPMPCDTSLVNDSLLIRVHVATQGSQARRPASTLKSSHPTHAAVRAAAGRTPRDTRRIPPCTLADSLAQASLSTASRSHLLSTVDVPALCAPQPLPASPGGSRGGGARPSAAPSRGSRDRMRQPSYKDVFTACLATPPRIPTYSMGWLDFRGNQVSESNSRLGTLRSAGIA
jgi:hypothetical protein